MDGDGAYVRSPGDISCREQEARSGEKCRPLTRVRFSAQEWTLALQTAHENHLLQALYYSVSLGFFFFPAWYTLSICASGVPAAPPELMEMCWGQPERGYFQANQGPTAVSAQMEPSCPWRGLHPRSCKEISKDQRVSLALRFRPQTCTICHSGVGLQPMALLFPG